MIRSKRNTSRSTKFQKRAQSKLSNLATKLNPNDPNWIDRYVEISTHLAFGDYDPNWFDDVHFDILRDLCNENLQSNYVVHLLTLLELMVPFLDSEDKIEQTIGSLLNIITGQSGKRTALVMNKYIYSATSLVLYTQEWKYKSSSIDDLYNVFIKFLLEKSRNSKSSLNEACFNALVEISTNSPPFLHRYISGNSIHDVHLALKLLIKFGFEIFSSLEEEFFMKQIVSLSTMPSLPIGYRLLCLSFIKIAFVSIYKPPLNSPPLGLIDTLCPYLFDGPDTQEKKMVILNEFSFVISDNEFFNLISRLHRLGDVHCANYKRSTSSLFRVLNIALKKRPPLTERILNFLLESIFSPSYTHYIEKLFVFLEQHWDFAQLMVDKFIAQLVILLKDQDNNNEGYQQVMSISQCPFIRTSNQYLAFLQLINWFLSIAHHHIVLTEFQLEFIVNFIRINCLQWPQSSTAALTCCTSILYYQRVTFKVKEALLIILEWLKSERKVDIETSSLAQIYLLALRTLKEEYIKQVFTSDEEEFLIQKVPESFDDYLCTIVRNERNQCPLIVERLKNEAPKERLKLGSSLWLSIPFQVYLSAASSLDRLFCVDILFTSPQIANLKQTFQMPLFEKGQERARLGLNVDFKVNGPFWLDITIRFVDYQGIIYNYEQPECEYISLEDVFIPIDVSPDQCTESLVQAIMQHPDSLQTVIVVRNHHSFESFFKHYQWVKQFVVDSMVDAVRLVNGNVNLFVTTNNYEIIPSFLLSTFANSDS
ncbi:hypothetical protein TYRP_000900 [Tyrophagus putrescentiae]|nr:hypothetical protein TYRP_000900 [Tyrophagus putrescentiae]